MTVDPAIMYLVAAAVVVVTLLIITIFFGDDSGFKNMSFKFNLGADGAEKRLFNTDTDLDEIPANNDENLLIRLRAYQKELTREGTDRETTIVLAPTNTGRTWVACYIIQQHLYRCVKAGRNGKVALIVDNEAVAIQQGNLCTENLRAHRTKVITGSVQRDNGQYLRDFVNRRDILVVTAMVLVNCLRKNEIADLTTFSLLLFDECHHFNNKHPYNQILSSYRRLKLNDRIDSRTLPQVVGLTSLLGVCGGADIDKAMDDMKQIVDNMDAKSLSIVSSKQGLVQMKGYENNSSDEELAATDFGTMSENPKLLKMQERFLLDNLGDGDNSRKIIFVRTKELVDALIAWMNANKEHKHVNADKSVDKNKSASIGELPENNQGKVSPIPVTSTPIQVEKRIKGQESPAAPPLFKLIPMRQEKDTVPQPIPHTAISHQMPSLDALDKQVLHMLDDHAIQVSKSDHGSVRELVWDLIYSKNITNEIEKCRLIFLWLATKNLNEMTFDHVDSGSPEEVLMRLKTRKTTYATVFDTMCNYAGLYSKIIKGYAKGVTYRLGQKFQPGSNRHSWNAVYIYGTWCLIDADWGARHALCTPEDLHYQLDKYFFLTEPAQLIFNHYPDDSQWQLLERPVTLEEFEEMPCIKPHFFECGLEIVSHKTVVVYGHGEVNIQLKYPAQRLVVAFNFSVQFDDGEEEYHGLKLKRYGMQESVGGVVSFRLRLPKKESFLLYIYAHKEDTPENKDNVSALVCKYKIVQEDVGLEPEPFPPCACITWGPNPAFFRYGLATDQQTATVLTRDGKTEIQFRTTKAMRFMAMLKHNERSDAEIEGYCMNRVVGNTAYFNITAPSRGEFGLEIYANDPSCGETTFTPVAQYLIECNEEVKAVPLPKLPTGYFGAQSKFHEFGLNTLTYHDPLIHLEKNTVEIEFATTQEMRMMAKLIDAESEQDFPEFVFIKNKDNVITLVVTLPSVGFYKLQLYVIPACETSQQLPNVFNYLINCKNVSQKAIPFPKQYKRWNEGCHIEGPLLLHPGCGNEVFYRVTVPKAEAVAVIAGGDWTHLQSPQTGLWEGKVDMSKHYSSNGSTKVTLNANYGGDGTSYATLLEYTV